MNNIASKTGHLRVAGFILVLLLSGCAATPLSEQLLHQPPANLQPAIELDAVAFFPQDAYQCGPAALATMLQQHEATITAAQLTPEVFIPELKGSLQPEMLAATRKRGLIPYQLRPELADILLEVQRGRPVLVLQNLGLSWFPQWHYAVVVGFDLQARTVVLRSGTERRHVVAMRTFERTWQRARHWAVVILKPGELPQQPEEWRYLQAIIGLEKSKRWDELKLAYRIGLQHWPEGRELRMGLGNLYYLQGEYATAALTYNEVLQREPHYAPALNNLAEAMAALGRWDEAIALAERAVQAGGANAQSYSATLQELKQRRPQ